MSRETRHTPPVRLTGDFIGHGDDSSPVSEGGTPLRWRTSFLLTVMKSQYVANFMVVVVLIDTWCTCTAIDARALMNDPSEAVLWISDICLVLYTLEAAILMTLTGMEFFRDWMMLMDLGIVSCGWLEILLTQFTAAADVLGFRIKVLRVLRLVRIFRPIRLLKRVRALRELYKLAMMMATVFRTLLWCFLLCFIVMTGWAMLMVEIVYPAVQDMHKTEGHFANCEQCRKATSSVMEANLLLFKTVIAGDGWGEIAVPVIQEHPGTAIIFVGSLLTLVFGVVNLIVAVVVDTFADARQNDVQNLAEEMEDEIEHDRKALAKLFARIDKDKSGQLTLHELIEGARHDRAFQSRLRVMDIDEQDLEQLFHMIDVDQSGTIEISEFIGPLSRWAHDSKTAPRFIKYNMLQSMHLQEDLYDLSVECFRELAGRIDDLALELNMKPGARDAKGSPTVRPLEEDPPGSPQEAMTRVASDYSKSQAAPQSQRLQEADKGLMTAVDAAVEQSIDISLQAAIAKIEAKLDLLFQESRKPRMYRSESLQSLKRVHGTPGAPGQTVAVDRLSMKRPPLDPQAFRTLYMRKSTMTSSPPLYIPSDGLNSWASASAETYNPFAGSTAPKGARIKKNPTEEPADRGSSLRQETMEIIDEEDVVMENSLI